MNNLKRIFSLALATVMVLGMMVVGASATDFVDDGDIENKTAVETMTALGIINGMDPEHFNPKGLVTRAQMAQMIAKALNGGEVPNYNLASKGSFTDVPADKWYAEAIEYCASLHIVGGYGDGTFKPEQNVTGQEAAKMMLVAMGYDETIFGFTGANWAVNVNYYATSLTTGGLNKPDYEDNTGIADASLYTDIDDSARNLPLTRDQAAQLIYNGLNANTVTSKVVGVQNGAPLYEYNMYNKSLLVSKFKATVATGKLTASKYNISTGKFTYTITADVANTLPATIDSTVDVSDYFQQGVRVVYKGTAAQPQILAISGISREAGNGVVATVDTTSEAGKIDGKDAANSVTWYNFNGTTTNETAAKAAGAWNEYKLLAGSDGKIDTVVVYPVTVAKVSAVRNGMVIAGSTFVVEDTGNTKADTVAKDTLAVGDYVTISTPTDLKKVLTKINPIENVIPTERAGVADTGTYTAGGNKYKLVSGKVTENGTGNTDSFKLGTSYTVVALNGFIHATTPSDASGSDATIGINDVLYVVTPGAVVATGTNALGTQTVYAQKVQILLNDGTKDVVDVENYGVDGQGKPVAVKPAVTGTDGAVTTPAVAVPAAGLYTYTVKDGKYSLNALSTLQGYTVSSDTTAITAGGIQKGTVTLRFAENAVLFVGYQTDPADNTTKTYAAMTGAQINAWKDTTGTLANTSKLFYATSANGFNYVSLGLIDLGTADLPGAARSLPEFGYVTSSAVTAWNPTGGADGKGASQLRVTIWNGTENKTYYVDTSKATNFAAGANLSKGDMITYTLADDVIVDGNKATAVATTVTGYDGAAAIALDGVEYSLEDTKVLGIKTSNGTGVANPTIQMAGTAGNNVYAVTAQRTGSNGASITYLAALYVDVDNAIPAVTVTGNKQGSDIKNLTDGVYNFTGTLTDANVSDFNNNGKNVIFKYTDGTEAATAATLTITGPGTFRYVENATGLTPGADHYFIINTEALGNGGNAQNPTGQMPAGTYTATVVVGTTTVLDVTFTVSR